MLALGRLLEWRPIPGFPYHAIREDGVIMRIVAGKTRRVGWVVRPSVTWDGYFRVKLTVDGRKHNLWVHRLVALAFIGPCPADKHEIAHWDGDKWHNHPANLRWVTQAENGADKARHGALAGERNGRARLTLDEVRRAREAYTGKHGEQSRLAREFGVSASAMRSALLGEHWRERT